MSRTRTHRSRPLVLGYLERVASKLFSDYSQELTDLVGRKHGVYALFKGRHLYYVGLAKNLKGRIKSHLRDKHRGRWDRFSLYLVRKVDHIRELESLVLRIADPSGNAVRGRLPYAENLAPILKHHVWESLTEEVEDIFEKTHRSANHRPQRNTRRQSMPRPPTLAAYVRKPLRLRKKYKGRLLSARVRVDGTVLFMGQVLASPSAAASMATGYPCDGWYFWSYREASGSWVELNNLRQQARHN